MLHQSQKASRVDEIRQLIKNKKTRTSLDLSNQQLTNNDVPALILLLNEIPNLVALNLSGNQLGNASIKAIVAQVPNIKLFEISRMKVDPANLDKEFDLLDVNTILFILATCEDLEVFNFSYNRMYFPLCTNKQNVYREDDVNPKNQKKIALLAYAQAPWSQLIAAIKSHEKLYRIDFRACGLAEEECTYFQDQIMRSGFFGFFGLSKQIVLVGNPKPKLKSESKEKEKKQTPLPKVSSSNSIHKETILVPSESKPNLAKKTRPLAKEIFHRELGLLQEGQLEVIRKMLA